ncbi:hypothetical protein [Streptomyces sp. NBC_01462]|uniref:hypothetical protein n=1 Tax=Streptomyces sp. NBC_01462 TaxID=2903876 RepID=UPI002E304E25|nr:hypothetical protein [Streptomyces sp. NBC_01462]
MPASLRTPDSTLTGDWIAHDPDLDLLWSTESGAAWAEFMNIDIPTPPPPPPPPLPLSPSTAP